MTLRLSPDEFLIAILNNIQREEKDRTFPTDREKLHNAFYILKKKYPEQMSSFRFRDKGFFFESEELDQALFDLEASKLLHRHNETPRYYFIQTQLQESYEYHVKGRLMDVGIGEDTLKNIADDFAIECSCAV